MLTPEQIEEMIRRLVGLYGDIEDDLIRNIAKRLSILHQVDPDTIADWLVSKLQELGALKKENIRSLAKLAGKTAEEIERIITQAGYETLKLDESLYQMAFNHGILPYSPIPVSASPLLKQIIQGAITNTRNYFNLINTTALQSAQDEFLKIINQVYLETSLGVTDFTSAVRKAVRNLADKGITGADYISAAGRRTRNQIDVAVRRAVVTSIGQTAGKMQLQRAQEWGNNLVEVTSHIGARPSHAVWQGKIYSIDDGTVEYPNLVQATGYGTVTGLCGANCRHTFFPFFPGLSEQTHKPYNLKENEKVYQETQQQRKFERDIRQQKRRILAADAAGDADTKAIAQLKLKEHEADLKSFLEKTGHMERSDLQQVVGFGHSQASQAVWVRKRVEKSANELYNLGNTRLNTEAYLRDKSLRDKIRSSETMKTLDPGQFRKHVPGTNEYKQYVEKLRRKGQFGPSRLNINEQQTQQLVEKYHGTGILSRDDKGRWKNEEIVTTHPDVIGIVVNNFTGVEAATSVFKIKYGKKGTHIIPDYPSKKGRKGPK